MILDQNGQVVSDDELPSDPDEPSERRTAAEPLGAHHVVGDVFLCMVCDRPIRGNWYLVRPRAVTFEGATLCCSIDCVAKGKR